MTTPLPPTQTPRPAAASARTLAACASLLASLILAASSHAQVAPGASPAATPAQLARFDKNKNGVLDADELAALQREEAASARAAAPATPADASSAAKSSSDII